MTNPEGITVSYEYDLLGRMSRIYNSSGMEVDYAYDCLDRLEQITYGNGIVTRYQYDDSGNISCLETKVGVTYHYDIRGQLLEENRNGDACCYTYDAAGNRLQRVNQEEITSYLIMRRISWFARREPGEKGPLYITRREV